MNVSHSRDMDHSTSRLHFKHSEICTVRGQITCHLNYFILNLSCSTRESYNDYVLSDTIQYSTIYTDNACVLICLFKM